MRPDVGRESFRQRRQSVYFIFLVFIARRSIAVAADSITLALTWAKTFSIHRQARGLNVTVPITRLLLRDGASSFDMHSKDNFMQ